MLPTKRTHSEFYKAIASVLPIYLYTGKQLMYIPKRSAEHALSCCGAERKATRVYVRDI